MDPDKGVDLLGYILTEADRILDKIYGDHVHANDDAHLEGGITEKKCGRGSGKG